MIRDEFGGVTQNELIGLLVTERIGQGTYRDVYGSHVLPDCVVKVEVGENRFNNPLEWIIWQEFKATKWAKWLAPCRFISACGVVLIQARCEPLGLRPRRVPAFLADLKAENWGTIKGHPVCFDYGNNHVFTLVADNAAMVKPKWHDLTASGRYTSPKAEAA